MPAYLHSRNLKYTAPFMAGQKNSYSHLFPFKILPGYVRIFQEEPFKLMLGNLDQLRIGATYLNNTEVSFLFVDSSGKLWGEPQKKHEAKKLNTALVMPPSSKGESPFPIFEQISSSNKALDFIMFFQYAWHFMQQSINNQEVKFPRVIVSDISFANVHSILDYFLKLKIKVYLKLAFGYLVDGREWDPPTVSGMRLNEFL